MNDKKKEKLKIIIVVSLYVICALLAVAAIVLSIWMYATYGGKPVDEVPSWVHWFMINK